MLADLKIIAEVVIEHYGKERGVTFKTIDESKSQLRDICYSRYFVYAIASELTKHSTTVLGFNIGKKNHATVIHGRNLIKTFCDTYPKYNNLYNYMLIECKIRLNSQIESYIKSYDKIVSQIVNEFAIKQKLSFEFWFADRVGDIAICGDYSFNLTDIIHDLRTKQTPGNIIQWYNNANGFNYQSWCMGLRNEHLKAT